MKLSLISSSTSKVLQKIKEHNKDLDLIRANKGKAPKTKHFSILIIESAFQEDNASLIYNPNLDQTKEIFDISFSKAVELLCQKHKHFIHDPAFELYVKIDEYEEENED